MNAKVESNFSDEAIALAKSMNDKGKTYGQIRGVLTATDAVDSGKQADELLAELGIEKKERVDYRQAMMNFLVEAARTEQEFVDWILETKPENVKYRKTDNKIRLATVELHKKAGVEFVEKPYVAAKAEAKADDGKDKTEVVAPAPQRRGRGRKSAA